MSALKNKLLVNNGNDIIGISSKCTIDKFIVIGICCDKVSKNEVISNVIRYPIEITVSFCHDKILQYWIYINSAFDFDKYWSCAATNCIRFNRSLFNYYQI